MSNAAIGDGSNAQIGKLVFTRSLGPEVKGNASADESNPFVPTAVEGTLDSMLRKQAAHKNLSSIDPDDVRIPDRGRSLVVLSRQLSALLGAGVQLVQSITILEEQAENSTFGSVLGDISKRLQAGHTFSKALNRYPRVFPSFFTGLIAVGERTGGLVLCIQHLANLLEKEDNLNRKVKGALTYPAFILGVTGFLTFILFKTVLPGFVDFFRNFEVPLPLPTKCLMMATNAVGSYWFWLFTIGIGWALSRRLKQLWAEPDQRATLYSWLLKIPGLGAILKYASLARYCWAMHLSLSAGLDILSCLKLAGSASDSPLLDHDSKRTQHCLREGDSLSIALKDKPELYPSLLVYMVKTAEESSEYSKSFDSAGRWFEQEVEERVEVFKAALEPILMAIVAVLVGGIILSIFLPLYGFLDKLGG